MTDIDLAPLEQWEIDHLKGSLKHAAGHPLAEGWAKTKRSTDTVKASPGQSLVIQHLARKNGFVRVTEDGTEVITELGSSWAHRAD